MNSSAWREELTRRDFVGRAAAGALGLSATADVFSHAAPADASPPFTVVLVNEAFLRQKYPKDAAALIEAARKFVQNQKGDIVNVGHETTAKGIKALLIRHPRRPKRLVLFGDEQAIPRFRVKYQWGPAYFFRGNQYIYYDFGSDKVADGYPQQLGARNWHNWPAAWNSGVDAAVNWGNGQVYFFKGKQYLRYDIAADKVADGYPLPLDSKHWRNWPADWNSGIDAAVNWGNGVIYFFKGRHYLRYEIGADRVAEGYPQPLDSKHWPNWPAGWNSVDSAINWGNGQAYFIRGSQYLRYDMATDKVCDGFPQPLNAQNWRNWPGEWNSGVRGAVDWGTTQDVDYFYGDLDGDGLTEVAVTRVLGSPKAMIHQLGMHPQNGNPHALFFAPDLRGSIELNQFASALGDHGHTIEERRWGDPTMLAQSDFIIHHAGHGNPDGWYGGYNDGTLVSVATVPELPRGPIVFSLCCSTAVPNAPIMNAFMERGCRLFIGNASNSYPFATGAYENEMYLHFVDALRKNPQATIAELVCEARSRYTRANGLAATLLKMERGQSPQTSVPVLTTAIQTELFGDITTTFPQALPKSLFSRHLLLSRTRTLARGDSIPVRFDVGPTAGVPTLLLHAEWDKDNSQGLEIDIVHDRQLLHKLVWQGSRRTAETADTTVGGYQESNRFQAFALAPLIRRLGPNEAQIIVRKSGKPIQIQPDSAVQIWGKREPGHPAPRQLVRQKGINLLWLCRNEDLGPVRDALSTIDHLQFEHQSDVGFWLDWYEFPDDRRRFPDLSHYDVVFLDDLGHGAFFNNGYDGFPRGMGGKIRDFVKRGGGLIMAGGPASFSAGNYGNTPLEEALPVHIASSDDRVIGSTKVGPVEAGHPIAAGLDWSSIPPILGYNRVTAKPAAQVLARTASQDPFLIVWQYGQGKAAAVTTRSARDWGANFKNWPYYRRFWGNLIRWVNRPASRRNNVQ